MCFSTFFLPTSFIFFCVIVNILISYLVLTSVTQTTSLPSFLSVNLAVFFSGLAHFKSLNYLVLHLLQDTFSRVLEWIAVRCFELDSFSSYLQSACA